MLPGAKNSFQQKQPENGGVYWKLFCCHTGILVWRSSVLPDLTHIGRRRHTGAFFKNLAEIIGIVSASYQFSHVLDLFFVIACQDFFCLLDPQVHQIAGKFLLGFFYKAAAYIVDIHVQMIFRDPFQSQVGVGHMVVQVIQKLLHHRAVGVGASLGGDHDLLQQEIYGDVASRCLELLEEFACENFQAVFDFANAVSGTSPGRLHRLWRPGERGGEGKAETDRRRGVYHGI